MDTITHGIAGALVGNAFFAERHLAASRTSAQGAPPPDPEQVRRDREAGRVAVWAATLGGVFPDGDVVFNLFDKSDLATLELHRGFTHSFVCLPFFAVILAALTRWVTRRRGWACPSAPMLTLIYATGLALHIVLDLITSFGTMIWSPLRNTRVAWDLTFILDFTLTGIVLLPQLLAWVYQRRERCRARALGMWVISSAATTLVWFVARATGFGFELRVVVGVSLLLAALFFLPAWRDSGFRVPRSRWCRASVGAMGAYLALCAVAHAAALKRVEQSATAERLAVEQLGALPLPPSLMRWAGLIRVPDGVHVAHFSLRDTKSPEFRFLADAAPNGYIAAARQLPQVKVFLWFARFPVFKYRQQGERHIVEIADLRFFARGQRAAAFTYRVTLDSRHRVLEEGWAEEE